MWHFWRTGGEILKFEVKWQWNKRERTCGAHWRHLLKEKPKSFLSLTLPIHTRDELIRPRIEQTIWCEFIHKNQFSGLRNKCGRRGVGRGNPRVRWEYRTLREVYSVLSPYLRVSPDQHQDFHICCNFNCFRVFFLFLFFLWTQKYLLKDLAKLRNK